jgi:hypothetical protein
MQCRKKEGGGRIGGRVGRKGNGVKEGREQNEGEVLGRAGDSRKTEHRRTEGRQTRKSWRFKWEHRSQARQQVIAATAMEGKRKEEEWGKILEEIHNNQTECDGNLHLELMGGQ